MKTGGAILQTYLLRLAVKMVRFLSVASLLFSSYIALVAAENIPRMQAKVVASLAGRDHCLRGQCEPHDIPPHQLSACSPYAQTRAVVASGAAFQARFAATTHIKHVRVQ